MSGTAHFGAFAGPIPTYGQQYAPLGTAQPGYGSAWSYDQGPLKAASPGDRPSALLAGLQQRKPFAAGQRRRLNVVPMLLGLFLPWLLFVLDFWVTSFSIRFDSPQLWAAVMIASVIAVFLVVMMAATRRLKLFQNGEREPSWLIFLAVSMLVALVLAYVLGNRNYSDYMRPYYDFHNLNIYTEIDPSRMRGQQLMDAGAIAFTEGTRLDVSRSMGFKHGSMYCVAPISFGNETMQTYDFWAVGTGCCSGSQADFHCHGWNSPHSGGLRLMGGGRDYYRLAVQQAEATYGIKAAHPLFFTWVPRPLDMIENWQTNARGSFVIWIFAHLLIQAFLVVCAALAFTRLGNI